MKTGMITNKELSKLLLHPDSIAVIGASGNPLKPGGRVFKNIKDGNYAGKLWPVNPKSDEIMGAKAYPGIPDLPGTPDLALIAIPAPGVIGAMQQLAAKGTKAVIILTAGFGEKGEEGKAEEQKILKLASANGMKVVGPNCSGFLTPIYAGKFAGIIPDLKPGTIDLVSGSGATVDYLMEQAATRGLRFSHVLNFGNSIQMGVEDMLELLDESHGPGSSKIVLIYMESVRKPQKLLKHVRSLVAKGCIFAGIKSGTTDAGAKAAASHTGAMASSDNAVQALFNKAGIIRVKSKAELIEVACALVCLKGAAKGNKAVIVTDAGGPGVMLSDELNRFGVELATFSEKTNERLAGILPPEAAWGNPIDCLPGRTAEIIQNVFTILGEEEADNIDFAFFVSGNSGMSDNGEIYQAIIELTKTCLIPILPVLSSATTCADLLEKVKESETIYFPDEVLVGYAVSQIVNRPVISDQSLSLDNYNKEGIAKVLADSGKILSPEAVETVLKKAGFKLPPQTEISSEAELKEACRKVTFPVVMKVVGPLHKSDVGGVKTDICHMEEACNAFKELMAIPDVKGVLIQKMVTGTEVILGAARDGDFGHLIMFGLGGIYTEVLKDVQFALAPLSTDEAMKMIRSLRSFKILEGVRGEAGISLDLLAEYLVRLGRLVTDFPIIQEMDLNPVKGVGKDLYAVDARIFILKKNLPTHLVFHPWFPCDRPEHS